jgi:hypothetical protein
MTTRRIGLAILTLLLAGTSLDLIWLNWSGSEEAATVLEPGVRKMDGPSEIPPTPQP